jgi:hypothetical protein
MLNKGKLFLCLFIGVLAKNPIEARVVIVHGALASNQEWYRPGGDFYDPLAKTAKQYHDVVEYYRWSGKVSIWDILTAGEELAEYVYRLKVDGEKNITLVGHSLGGYVIRAASQFLNNMRTTLDYGYNGTLAVQEQQSIKQHFTLLHQTCDRNCKNIIGKKKKNKTSEGYLINAVFTLGTPNEMFSMYADDTVVGNLYNVYSKGGDLIQDIMGDRKLSKQEDVNPRFIDIGIAYIEDYHQCDCGCFGFCHPPSHFAMHNGIVGKWILTLPDVLIKQEFGEKTESGIYLFNGDVFADLFNQHIPIVKEDCAGNKSVALFRVAENTKTPPAE